MLDIKTTMISYAISNVLVAIIITLLWQQNQKRYAGLSYWLLGYLLQVVGSLLIYPRDILPEIVTVILANLLIIGGLFCLYVGLECFVGKTRPQIHNYLLLVVFTILLAYFTFIRPDISIRAIVVSGALIFLALQCSDLMIRRVDSPLKTITRSVSIVFILYTVTALASIVLIELQPLAPRTDLFQLPVGQVFIVLVFQMLNIGLTFALIMMVTQRLWLDGQTQVSECLRMEETLRRMNERLSLATRAGRLGIWDWDLQKNQLIWDDQMYELYGLKKEEFAGAYEAWLKGIHPDDRAKSDEISKQAQRGEREYDTEFRVVWPDGTIRYLKAYGQFMRDDAGNPIRMTGINYDITERKRAEAEIENVAKFPSENPYPVLRIGQEGKVLYANSASAPLLNEWECQVGQALPAQWCELVQNVTGTLVSQNAEVHTDGRVFLLTFSPIVKAGYVNVYGLDITKRKQAEEELRQAHEFAEAANRELAQAFEREKLLARTDSLTGVYNRRQFFELAEHEFAMAKRYHRPLSVLIFDIDHFKQVNDTFGHQVGDDLLKRTAQIASEHLRETDILARYGGDEFSVLLPDSNSQASTIVAQRIRENVAVYKLVTERGKAGVTISIGISECLENDFTLDYLFQQADQAMYAAKEAGRNRIMIYSPDN